MRTPPSLRRSTVLLFALALVAGSAASAQQPQQAQPFKPEVGQGGKDVVWVPTPQALVDKMLDMAGVTPQDLVMDLGSGDGITVISAAKRGARAIGIEYNPDMVELSKQNAEKAGVSDKATFMKADLFETDLSQATVITMFLLPQINMRLRPKILDLKPGTRIVSNSFTMGEWESDSRADATDKEGCVSYCTAYLWIVPAKVEGTWRSPQGEFDLRQTFQKFTGFLKSGGTATAFTNGRIRGDQVSFTVSGAQYSGRVRGDTIDGTVKSAAGTSPWKATRAK